MRFDFERYLAGKRPLARIKSRGEAVLVTHCIDPACRDFARPQRQRLWIYENKANAFCFRCGRYFSPIDTVMLFEGLSFKEAEDFVREYAGESATVALSDVLYRMRKTSWGVKEEAKEEKRERTERVKLPSSFTTYDEVGKLPRYVRERGLALKTLATYSIGWCTKGRYANRLIVPVYQNGELAGWIARLMQTKVPANVKKVVNPPGVNMSKLLFNYDAAKNGKTIVLVEGVFDAMAIGKQAVALFGTNLSHDQLALLQKTKAKRVVVLFDPDAHDKALRLADKLSIHFRTSAPRIARDPDELSPRELAKALATGAPSVVDRLASTLGDLHPSRG